MPPRRRPELPSSGSADDSIGSPGLGTVAGELYQVEPSGFTAARSARAAEAREKGDRDLAKLIGKLARPSRAAFALNLLAHRRPDDVRRLAQLAASLRDASTRLAGSELRELGSTRRKLIAELASAAAQLAEEAGAPLSGPTSEEVEETLQAALLDEEAAEAVVSGHLVRSISIAAVGTAELATALPALTIEKVSRPDKRAATGSRAGATASSPRVPPEPKGGAPARRRAADETGGQRRGEAEAKARLREADEAARRAAAAAGAARKDTEKARRAREAALARRKDAEAALARARVDDAAASKALSAAQAAEQRANAAEKAAESARREASREASRRAPR